MAEATTDQDRKVPNPTGKGGFGDNPENRNPGGWRKSDTPRYKLEQMMKLSDNDLDDLIEDTETPRFEKNMATAIKEGRWREIEGMINQVYGKPQESVDVTSKGEQLGAIISFETKPQD